MSKNSICGIRTLDDYYYSVYINRPPMFDILEDYFDDEDFSLSEFTTEVNRLLQNNYIIDLCNEKEHLQSKFSFGDKFGLYRIPDEFGDNSGLCRKELRCTSELDLNIDIQAITIDILNMIDETITIDELKTLVKCNHMNMAITEDTLNIVNTLIVCNILNSTNKNIHINSELECNSDIHVYLKNDIHVKTECNSDIHLKNFRANHFDSSEDGITSDHQNRHCLINSHEEIYVQISYRLDMLYRSIVYQINVISIQQKILRHRGGVG
jgi:hypothetical protein